MLLVLCCEPVFCTLCRPIPNYSDGGILLSCCMGDMHVVGLDESTDYIPDARIMASLRSVNLNSTTSVQVRL